MSSLSASWLKKQKRQNKFFCCIGGGGTDAGIVFGIGFRPKAARYARAEQSPGLCPEPVQRPLHMRSI
ncbi:MAG: hypothetical protein IPO31_13685 [Candidatus Obscuribacter sp.]|nr:hypothetical protein [Candidatus Obscuribacter sp.]